MNESESSLPSDRPAIVFIGGAPRSGTTLLCNLLDGHKGLLAFPTEHSTIERSVWNRHRLESYAREEFISGRGEGQQVMLANSHLYEEKQVAFEAEFRRKIELDVDRQSFHAAYLEALENKQANLENILAALAIALSQSNSFAAKAYEHARWLCFKQPFFTELFASETAKLIPGSKFIHILRDPIARYTSAKTRHVKQAKIAGRRLGPINRLSYAEGHTLIDVASHRLSQQNQETIGADRYKLIRFEDLATAPQETISGILTWLGLEADDSHTMKPTRLGQSANARSNISTGNQIDSSATLRSGQYHDLTSWNERLIHSALLNLLLNRSQTPNAVAMLAAYLTPLPNASWKCYAGQMQGLIRWFRGDYETAMATFLDKAKAGKASVSGAT